MTPRPFTVRDDGQPRTPTPLAVQVASSDGGQLASVPLRADPDGGYSATLDCWRFYVSRVRSGPPPAWEE